MPRAESKARAARAAHAARGDLLEEAVGDLAVVGVEPEQAGEVLDHPLPVGERHLARVLVVSAVPRSGVVREAALGHELADDGGLPARALRELHLRDDRAFLQHVAAVCADRLAARPVAVDLVGKAFRAALWRHVTAESPNLQQEVLSLGFPAVIT